VKLNGIGDHVTVKCGVYLWDGVRLEDKVFIGPNVTFTNDRHPRSGGAFRLLVTTVREGASIGAAAVIGPGVTIGRYAMVGMGAVVLKDVPDHALVYGNPAEAAITVQGRRQHEGTIFEGLDPRRRPYYWIEEGKDNWHSDEMSDIHAVRSGLISITPLQSDTTHHATLTAFRAWETVLKNGHRG